MLFPEILPGQDEEDIPKTGNTVIPKESATKSRIPEQVSALYYFSFTTWKQVRMKKTWLYRIMLYVFMQLLLINWCSFLVQMLES